ncbi:hypothetical protein [Qipengyuania qiaonensis]|uniref:Nuclear transport factor 2 family protein n=1 Tax=Qipengyuania qiaonensis TaxID=2867240 RepID=A0ABS7J9P1_9SPHN|nr:hypothetical protein [Qipengyuania qiaonensis]MBX7481707.1 hypothetical protein [Qipengyuania qiaonensis]
MPHTMRSQRFPADRLKLLLTRRPFDRAMWLEALGEQPHLRIANAPPVTGRVQVLDEIATFLGRIEGFGNQFCDVWQRRETIYAETDVTFRSHTGNLDAIPCVIIARTTHGVLQDLRFHLDPAPLP